ncbi:DUF559 domain-containing protein [Mycobacterium sp. CBMA293]|uniref:DUF559 domain-containing protein n=1 Tax=unclassified Mycolicibacterium TaxID=2636767 RepID=UPI0012DBD709|nr:MULTISPECIES: DUF559 domain-containing protein [unclassified Mycolicibacterium]MUL46706.1 DUF559 domain-containing protein [Mycolicibacterium sp. CBMA 360]MUL58993.1 DUF559 domain-containing protein [Mycolicibacterium sp. CBMA 335]MUL69387.1 DUF559 domain-containing protein [Mycolicibacterium sp. CBMA 311]MUL94351.1 DUF559 domain-containing protein [Mycolicibacterium sp. CBMA 230]MUM06633.1 hypothetical protein [Mycolicibacterium sp. CBMA 213]
MTEPFIGSEALAAGLINRYQLTRYHRPVLPNVYVDKRIALSLQQRSTAAWLWSGRDAVIAGSAASALHGARWVADDVPIELISTKTKPPRDVIARRELIRDGEITRIGGLPVTSAERTAFDLGRRGLIGAAVARLDALARATEFKADDVLALAEQHRHARGMRQLERALDLFDAGGQSPKETALRLMLIHAGFPPPQTQIPVLGPDGYPMYFLDMGWEELMLAVEYDGMQHADQLGYDINRADYLTRVGWTHVRVAAGHRRPGIIARVEREWNRLWRPGLGITQRRPPLKGPPLERGC